jgi:biotin transport system substrate-specific component
MTTVARSAPRSSRIAIIGIVGFAAAVAAASQIAIPLPWTPVPVTLTPMLVVLTGLWLGPIAGAASMTLYLAAGAIGLPVFTPIGPPGVERFLGPTGGYLIAYPLAAYVAGALGRLTSTLTGRWVAAMAGIAVIFVGGLSQLTLFYGSTARALELGVTPFAALDLVKALIAAAITSPRITRRDA